MAVEVWTLWALVIGQMIAISLLARSVARLASARIPASSSTPFHRGEHFTTQHIERISEIPSAAATEGAPRAYLFVSPTCPICEGILEALRRDVFQGYQALLVATATKEEALIRFGGRARKIGIGLAATRRAFDLGVSQVPFLVVTVGESEKAVLQRPVTDVYDLEVRLKRFTAGSATSSESAERR
ncbi:MAG: hypothetical protein M0Z66_02840 [Thermaerobacter sp.]|nr:hypothetical protein [Thermaerobacter sp.]